MWGEFCDTYSPNAENNFKRLSNTLNEKLGNLANEYYHLGVANTLAITLKFLETDEPENIKKFINLFIEENEILRDRVYDLMKDL